jgi:peptidoglycan glycosyltransferase
LSKRCVAALVAMLLLVSCTPSGAEDPDEPRPIPEGWAEAALELLEGMAESDRVLLLELAPTTKDARRTIKAVRTARREAFISAVDIELSGDIEVPSQLLEPDSTVPLDGTVPYSVVWDSDVITAEEPMTGEVALTHSEAEGWTPAFAGDLLWPGVPRARGVAIRSKWLRRGRILDRKGRVLAAGSAEERRYPQGSLAGTTIGHIEPWSVAAGELGVVGAPGDLIGGSGLEEGFQEKLGGSPTVKLVVVDRKGDPLERLGRETGEPGDDLRTTLDIDVQRAAEAAYRTTGGAVVLDPSTGDILAVADSSTFGPGNYTGVEGVEPFNRALSGRYPPGSSMKVVTAAAALETGVVKPTTTLSGPAEYQGVRNFESGAFGSIPFSDAVRFSVNTAFAQVAIDLGGRRLTRFAEAFGFNRPPGMALGAATPSFPRPEGISDLMWGSIGQAQVLATPLQMASVAATIANDGKRMEPRIDRDEPKDGTRVVSVKAARSLAEMMEGAVRSGTGVNAQISGLRIAGKTGTAEVDVAGERKNHAWFVCFAPVGDARFALAVVSEYGGVGGQVAAPIARSIMTGILPHLGR